MLAELDTHQVVTSATLLALVPIVAYLVKLSMHYARISLMVETMWAFMMRRGLQAGLAGNDPSLKRNSPIQSTGKLDPYFALLTGELQKLYHEQSLDKLTDEAAMMMIESRFGKRIMDEVCNPSGTASGECLWVALSLARQDACPVKPNIDPSAATP
jgi:hypothetical protein